MSRTPTSRLGAAVPAALLLGLCAAAGADEFDDAELARWQQQYFDVVAEGRRLFTSDELGTNKLVCAQCHPNAANAHPETYPKLQQQLGRVVSLWEMINWCIRNPLEGEAMHPADPRMIALEAYIHEERRGVPLSPGKH
jgi:thiosulfate dehydrogenase